MTTEIVIRAVIIFIGIVAYGSLCKYIGYKKAYDTCKNAAEKTIAKAVADTKSVADKFMKDIEHLYSERCSKCIIKRIDNAMGREREGESKYVGDMQRD